MAILQYKVMSYRENCGPDEINEYLLGIYDTKEVADRVCNDYNYIWLDSPLYAVVERNT